jgi:hypothetical protein
MPVAARAWGWASVVKGLFGLSLDIGKFRWGAEWTRRDPVF